MVRPGPVKASTWAPLCWPWLWLSLWCCQLNAGGAYEGFSAPEIRYPVETPGMQAAIGEIDRPLEFTPLRSIAIVGADDISARWLTINQDYLKSLGAIGIVVNVESVEQLQILKKHASIPLIALPGDWAVVHYGPVYPILIDARAGRLRQ